MQQRDSLIQQREWELEQSRSAPLPTLDEVLDQEQQPEHIPPTQRDFFACTDLSQRLSTQGSDQLPSQRPATNNDLDDQFWSGTSKSIIDEEIEHVLRAEEDELDELLALKDADSLVHSYGDHVMSEPASEISDYGNEIDDTHLEQAMVGVETQRERRSSCDGSENMHRMDMT